MKTAHQVITGIFLGSLYLISNTVFAAASDGDIKAAKTTLMGSVAIPTVAGRGQVPELAGYYAGILQNAGFFCRRYPHHPNG